MLKVFSIEDLFNTKSADFLLDYAINYPERSDFLSQQARSVAEGIMSLQSFIPTLFHVFYRTGIVGLKTETYESFQWSYNGPSTIASETITQNTRVQIHPTFWRVLGIKPS
jgi:hypothetical protein